MESRASYSFMAVLCVNSIILYPQIINHVRMRVRKKKISNRTFLNLHWDLVFTEDVWQIAENFNTMVRSIVQGTHPGEQRDHPFYFERW